MQGYDFGITSVENRITLAFRVPVCQLSITLVQAYISLTFREFVIPGGVKYRLHRDHSTLLRYFVVLHRGDLVK
jgi:hypothetical protein